MKLYSIRHKTTNRFLVAVHPRGGLSWSDAPVFWKTIDGPKGTLARYAGKANGFHWEDGKAHDAHKDSVGYSKAYNTYWTDIDPKKLDDLEVVVTEVSLQGFTTITAQELMAEHLTAGESDVFKEA